VKALFPGTFLECKCKYLELGADFYKEFFEESVEIWKRSRYRERFSS
jgi:hypothetical protein